MKVAIIYNKDFSHVINSFGIQNKEVYNPETVKLVADALEQGGITCGSLTATWE